MCTVPLSVTQLCSLERRIARGGRDSIDHPTNAQDDVANAVAGAIEEAFCTSRRQPTASLVAPLFRAMSMTGARIIRAISYNSS